MVAMTTTENTFNEQNAANAAEAKAVKPKRVSQSFSLPPELLERINTEADSRVLSASHLVERLLARGLDTLPPVD